MKRLLIALSFLICHLSFSSAGAQTRRPIDNEHPLWMIHINTVLTFVMPDDIVTLQPVFAKGVNIVDGIDIVNADGTRTTAIYDLSGRHVSTLSKKGIYIKNGKKYYIK